MRKLTFLLLVLLVSALSGCSEDVVVKRIMPQSLAAREVKEVEDISAELADFKPPHPARLAPFEPEKNPPRSDGAFRSTAGTSESAIDEAQPDIELVGFGSVDQQHALLMIDGRLEALRVGENYGAVHVLQISPPSVQLRVAGRLTEAKMTAEQGG